MRIVEPSVNVLTPLDGNYVLRFIEKCGRPNQEINDATADISARSFAQDVINSGDESAFKHFSITAIWTCSTAVAHQLGIYPTNCMVNCEVGVIKPVAVPEMGDAYEAWRESCKSAELSFNRLVDMGVKPQNASTVLPMCLKTDIVITMNLADWRLFLKENCDIHTQPDIRLLALKTLRKFCAAVPVVFNGI